MILRNPALAAVLAWLVPGLGHIYQGRIAKGVSFFFVILGLFIYGNRLGAGRVVFFRWDKSEWRTPYLGQIGVGLLALPASFDGLGLRETFAKLLPAFADYQAKPLEQQELKDLCRKLSVNMVDQSDEKLAESLRTEKNLKWVVSLEEVNELHRTLGIQMDLALIYTLVAGLLNILAIYDAAAGPAQYLDDFLQKQKAKSQAESTSA